MLDPPVSSSRARSAAVVVLGSVGLVALIAASASGADPSEDEKVRRAREEVEAQLKQVVATTPPRLVISFSDETAADFELLEAKFSLDGRVIAVPSVEEVGRPGRHVV